MMAVESTEETTKMGEETRYTFKIEGFTPKSMPFVRLVSYYAEIVKMLGGDEIHLVGVRESSHKTAFYVPEETEVKVDERLLAISQGRGPRAAQTARCNIDKMLKEDGTRGEFSDKQGRTVIQFQGNGYAESLLYSIQEATTFTGGLYYIAGTKNGANVRIANEAYGAVFCTTNRNLAKDLGGHLFEDIKVSGRGTWFRSEDGKWLIDEFAIIEFEPVQKDSLRTTVDRLRKLEIDWPDDPIHEIYKVNEEDGHIH